MNYKKKITHIYRLPQWNLSTIKSNWNKISVLTASLDVYSRIHSINRKYFNCILPYSFYIVSELINDIPMFGNLWNLKYISYPMAESWKKHKRNTALYGHNIFYGGEGRERERENGAGNRTGTHNITTNSYWHFS